MTMGHGAARGSGHRRGAIGIDAPLFL